MDLRNVIIIGSGPAGLTAAIYTSRAGLKPLLVEGANAGGQLMTTTEVDNFPGFPDGITGPELISNIKSQAQKFGTEFILGDVTSVNFENRPFEVKIGDKEYKTKTIIIATGANAKYLNIDSVNILKGKGISACATCDGFFYRDKIVYVIGGGDSALEEAEFLTRFAKKVYIVHRRDEFRASKFVQESAKKNEKIEYFLSHVLVDAIGEKDGKVTGIKLKNLKTDEIIENKADGIFFAIGHSPNTEIFKPKLKLKDNNYISTVNDRTLTNIEGVFAAGDVHDDYYRQAITAAGEGCKAALEVEKFLILNKEI